LIAFVAKKNGAMYFSGLTCQPVGRDALTVYVAMRESGGVLEEEPFTFTRALRRAMASAAAVAGGISCINSWCRGVHPDAAIPRIACADSFPSF
jgi:hypothetical protein